MHTYMHTPFLHVPLPFLLSLSLFLLSLSVLCMNIKNRPNQSSDLNRNKCLDVYNQYKSGCHQQQCGSTKRKNGCLNWKQTHKDVD